MKADISTLHKPDILTLQRQALAERLIPRLGSLYDARQNVQSETKPKEHDIGYG